MSPLSINAVYPAFLSIQPTLATINNPHPWISSEGGYLEIWKKCDSCSPCPNLEVYVCPLVISWVLDITSQSAPETLFCIRFVTLGPQVNSSSARQAPNYINFELLWSVTKGNCKIPWDEMELWMSLNDELTVTGAVLGEIKAERNAGQGLSSSTNCRLCPWRWTPSVAHPISPFKTLPANDRIFRNAFFLPTGLNVMLWF